MINLPEVLTIALGFVAVIGSNIALFLWSRGESRADNRHLESWAKAAIEAIHTEMRHFHNAMQIESKDFHARLCVIEERSRGKKH